MIVTTRPEPPVIQHIAFHPQRSGPLGQVDQPCNVVIEIDSLPDVQANRALRVGMQRQSPQMLMEAFCLSVQADSMIEVDPW